MNVFSWRKRLICVLICCWPAVPASAQPDVDPLDPFDGLSSAAEWIEKFTIEADPDRGDPFHNLTASEWWAGTWNGEWSSAAAEGRSFEEFYAEFQGQSGNSVALRSPYPYGSAEDHWNAWRQAAGARTATTPRTLPDWSGDWQTRAVVTRGAIQVRDLWEGVSEEYKPRFERGLQAELEGSHWWPADTCLPNGYFRNGWSMRYVLLNDQVMIMAEDQPLNEYRVTYHDDRGFLPEGIVFPTWYGQSQGFWDGDELIVWVKDIKGWYAGHGLPEYSAELQIIERWKRIADEIVVDVTLYDPLAFAFPWHEVVLHTLREDWTQPPPAHNECVSTNNVYHDESGRIAELGPDDPRYRDIFDARPWAGVFGQMEEAKRTGRLPAAPSFLTVSPAQ